jgi:hypothetical protein
VEHHTPSRGNDVSPPDAAVAIKLDLFLNARHSRAKRTPLGRTASSIATPDIYPPFVVDGVGVVVGLAVVVGFAVVVGVAVVVVVVVVVVAGEAAACAGTITD